MKCTCCKFIFFKLTVVVQPLEELALEGNCRSFFDGGPEILELRVGKTVSDPAWGSRALAYNYRVNPDDSLWSLQTSGHRPRQTGFGTDLSHCTVGHWMHVRKLSVRLLVWSAYALFQNPLVLFYAHSLCKRLCFQIPEMQMMKKRKKIKTHFSKCCSCFKCMQCIHLMIRYCISPIYMMNTFVCSYSWKPNLVLSQFLRFFIFWYLTPKPLLI